MVMDTTTADTTDNTPPLTIDERAQLHADLVAAAAEASLCAVVGSYRASGEPSGVEAAIELVALQKLRKRGFYVLLHLDEVAVGRDQYAIRQWLFDNQPIRTAG